MTMPFAQFGRTGHLSSRAIFGAAALGAMNQDNADAVLELLPEFGINHIDTAASYGAAEVRLAPWLATHRSQVFLATKTGERTGDSARAELERSLQRMGVDSIDLIQLHNLVEPEEWDVAHGPGGVVEALVKAREEGLVRFIGVTGHGTRIPSMHLRSLDRFPFDSVLFPLNHTLMTLDYYAADAHALLDRCAADNIAVQTIKSIARGRWRNDDTPHFSWYEPLTDTAAINRAVSYVLDYGQAFVNTTSDTRRLRTVLEAICNPVPVESAALENDRSDQGMTVLFDGAELERI